MSVYLWRTDLGICVAFHKIIMSDSKNTAYDAKPDDDLGEPDIKIILLGDSAVGKSKLVERFMMNEFQPRQVPAIQSHVSMLNTYCSSYRRLHLHYFENKLKLKMIMANQTLLTLVRIVFI